MLGLGSGMNKTSSAEAAAIAGRLPGFTGLLDESYGASAEAAYSVRKLTNRVSVAMTIRRDSDSTETDIGFDSNGNLDEGAITAFCTGTTCRVASWKDQSGNDNHAVQAVASNQPTIYTGGALVKDGGRVAMTSTGSTSFDFTRISDINSVFSVLRPTDFTTTRNSFILGDTVNSDYHSDYNGGWLGNNSATVVRNGANYLNGSSVTLTGLTRSAGQYVLSMIHTANTARANTISQDRNAQYGQRSWIGNRQELIIYSDDRTNDRAQIESNVGDYFTQNTPLLDTYTGAAAAYSLRKLSSSYSGPAIRVRRDNDNLETDINFNVFGELDTVSLAAHCGSNNGYVTNWYDQSSNSNTARQTTASNQPKIYDGTTGVVLENGKPTVQFDGSKYIGIGNYSSLTEGELFTTVRWLGDTSTRGGFKISTQGNDMHFPYYGGLVYDNFGSTTRYSFNPSITLNQINLYNTLSKSGEWTARLNGNVEKTSATNTVGFSSGRIGTNGQTMNHNFSEFILYNAVQSASNRTNIEDNINTFYSI